jgi:hypothetical protein
MLYKGRVVDLDHVNSHKTVQNNAQRQRLLLSLPLSRQISHFRVVCFTSTHSLSAGTYENPSKHSKDCRTRTRTNEFFSCEDQTYIRAYRRNGKRTRRLDREMGDIFNPAPLTSRRREESIRRVEKEDDANIPGSLSFRSTCSLTTHNVSHCVSLLVLCYMHRIKSRI